MSYFEKELHDDRFQILEKTLGYGFLTQNVQKRKVVVLTFLPSTVASKMYPAGRSDGAFTLRFIVVVVVASACCYLLVPIDYDRLKEIRSMIFKVSFNLQLMEIL